MPKGAPIPAGYGGAGPYGGEMGRSLALSSNGDRLAIGGPSAFSDPNSGTGRVEIRSFEADLDTDKDGVADVVDAFPLISLGGLNDTDDDGRPDDCDNRCLGTVMTADSDDDDDGVLDARDAFPLVSLAGLSDPDGDGYPSDCDELVPSPCDGTAMISDVDDDNDGFQDEIDEFPLDALEHIDSDSDGVGDNGDNCPSVSNSAQTNNDGDEAGDACDLDDDNDGLTDDQELSLGTNPLLKDTDGDGWSDSEEVEEGTDPLAPTSQPELPSGLPVWLLREATESTNTQPMN